MIDLTDDECRSGALDALKVLLASKIAPLRADNGGEDGQNNQGLKMPKNTKQIDDDAPDEDEEDNNKKDNKEEGQPSGDDKDKDKNNQSSNEEDNTNPDETRSKGQQRKDKAKRVKDELLKDADKILNDIKKEVGARNLDAARKAKAREYDDLKLKAKQKAENTILDLSNFERDLKRALLSQLAAINNLEQTFKKPNPTYAGTSYLMPANQREIRKTTASINIYFDCSGSIDEASLERARKVLTELDFYVRKKQISFNIFYFADNVTPERSEVYGKTRAYPHILDHIRTTRPDNVMIITDDDFEKQVFRNTELTAQCKQVDIKGAVW